MFKKKIAAICLLTSNPMLIRAAWTNGELYMTPTELIPKSREAAAPYLIERINELEAAGHEVLVAEHTDFITSRAGIRIRLDDMANDGIPVIVHAVNIQKELSRQSAIFYPQESGGKGRFELSETIVNTEHDKKGKASYDIAYDQLKSEQVLALLCCYATAFHNASSDSYLTAMFGDLDANQSHEPLSTFGKIIMAQERTAIENGPRGTLTGKEGYL